MQRGSDPTYRIRIGGADASATLAADVHDVVVDQATDRADAFVITLSNDHCKWSDKPLLRPGARIQIELGYGATGTVPVIDGEVISWKASYPRRGPSLLRVQGATRFHRLKRPKLTRAFPAGSRPSDVARTIAREVGLGEKGVEDGGPALENVFQHDQTNLELLLLLARRIGFEVFAAAGQLHFRKPPLADGKVAGFEWKRDLVSFRLRSSVARVPTKVDVRAFDGPAGKRVVVASAQKGEEGPALGGATSGVELSAALGTARQHIVFEALRTHPDEAKALAVATLARANRETVQAEAVCQGAPSIQAGRIVEVTGVGSSASGLYYVERAVHALLPEGFTTTLVLGRTSVGRATAKAPKGIGSKKPPPPGPKPPPPRVSDLWVRIDIPPREASSRGDRYVLTSQDDEFQYRQEKSVKDDKVPGDQWIDLRFTGLRVDKAYTLHIVRPGAKPHAVFEDVPYSQLAGLSGEPGGDEGGGADEMAGGDDGAAARDAELELE